MIKWLPVTDDCMHSADLKWTIVRVPMFGGGGRYELYKERRAPPMRAGLTWAECKAAAESWQA